MNVLSNWNCWWHTSVCSVKSLSVSPATCLDFGAIPVSFLFGWKQLCPVLSVALEQLVDEAELILLLRRIERWEGVPFVLQYSHFGSVKVLPVGETCHPRVAARLTLKPRCEDLEKLWNQILLLQGREVIQTQQSASSCFDLQGQHVQLDAANRSRYPPSAKNWPFSLLSH